jgi:TPR repeat protein
VFENREAGLKELRKLARAGDKSAIVFLGQYLSEESETTEEATKWLLLASEFESPDAAWNLAMIARERGDNDGMKQWIDRAASLGEEDAAEIRDNGYDVDAFLANLRE